MSVHMRKSMADVLRRKAQSVALLLAILLPVVGLTAVGVASDSLASAYAFTVSAHANGQDVVVTVDRTNPTLVVAVSASPNVRRVQLATVMDTQWLVAPAPGHVSFRIVGYPDPGHVALQPFQLVSGRDPGPGEIVMEYGDAGVQPVHVGDLVTVDTSTGTASLRVVGLARTAGVDPAVSGQGVGYMSTAALDRLPAFGYAPGAVQRQPLRTEQIAIELRDPSAYQATIEDLGSAFRSHQVTVLGILPPAENAPLAQLQGVLTLAALLLVLALAVAATLVVTSVTALVTAQTSVIGIMKALGATRWTVARGYLTTVLLYAAAATPIGIAIGVASGAQLASGMEASIPIAPGPTVLSLETGAVAIGVGILLPLVAAVIPVWLGTRVTVHQAITMWGLTGGEGGTRRPRRRASRGWRSAVPQTIWLGLRGLFRRPLRAAASIVAVAVTGSCFLVVQSLASSVDTSIGSVWGSFQADVEVYVSEQSTYQQVSTLLDTVPNVGVIERVGWFGSQTVWGKVGVWGIEPDSRIHRARITSGRWFTSAETDVCLVSDDLAARAGLRAGSIITVPGPGGGHAIRFMVIGTVDEPVDDLGQVGTIDMPVNALYELEGVPPADISDYTNRVLVQAVDRSPAAVDQLTRAIDAAGRIQAREGPIAEVFGFQDEVLRHQRNFLPVYALLLVVVLIVGTVGALGLADALTSSVLERPRDIGLLRALGATGRRIASVFWVEGLAVSLMGWSVAAAIGVPMTYGVVQLFRHGVMPTDFHFAPQSLVLMISVTLALASAATTLPARRAAGLRSAELLRSE